MKGEYNQECNITSCQKPNSATWYNHSTQKYYCPSCAKRINSDEFNKRDAMRLFGHDLCTEEGYFIEFNGANYQSVFPTLEAEKSQLHSDLTDAQHYMVVECGVDKNLIKIV